MRPALIDAVRNERTTEPLLLPDEAVSVVRRRLLNGEELTARDLPSTSSLIHARRTLEAVGFKFAERTGPYEGPNSGRPRIYYRISNLDHDPYEPVKTPKPKPTKKPTRSEELAARLAPDERRSNPVAERLLANVREVVDFRDSPNMSTVHSAVSVLRKKKGWKIESRGQGQYILLTMPKFKRGEKRPGTELQRVENPESHGLNGMAPMVQSLMGLKVRALSLDDDGQIHIALRNGDSTLVATVTGLVPNKKD